MVRGSLSLDQRTARAERHCTAGSALADAGDEWSAVCFFYAAYHLVARALTEDAIFADITRLHAKHRDLVPRDRFTSRHHGRMNSNKGREWGVNELVALLYPQIVQSYERLHQVSIDVRYGSGCRISISTLRQALTTIQRRTFPWRVDRLNWSGTGARRAVTSRRRRGRDHHLQ